MHDLVAWFGSLTEGEFRFYLFLWIFLVGLTAGAR